MARGLKRNPKILTIAGLLLVSTVAMASPISGINTEEFEPSAPNQLKWDNNPFVQSVDAVGVQELNLTAIVYRPNHAAILLNDHMLREGDKMGDIQVMHIEPKKVVLRNQDGLFSLSLSGAVK